MWFQAITELGTFMLFKKQSCDLCADQGQQSISLAAGCYSELIFISLGFVDLQNSFTLESCLRSIRTEALGEGFKQNNGTF